MKKIILLDVDGCMYHGHSPDGGLSVYTAHARATTEAWGSQMSGRPIEELREYRNTHAPNIGLDQSLLDFINLYREEPATIADIALYRASPNGFQPERFLTKNENLCLSLRTARDAGYTLVVVSDNPIAHRIIRHLGIDTTLIPDEMIFDAVRMNAFKNTTTMQAVLTELNATPEEAAMFGDSLRSDIIPAQSIGIAAFLADGPEALIQALEGYIKRA